MPDDEDNIDWNTIDADWVAENRPMKLNEQHREKLILKHGQRAGTDKFVGAVNLALRKIKIGPPHRGGR